MSHERIKSVLIISEDMQILPSQKLGEKLYCSVIRSNIKYARVDTKGVKMFYYINISAASSLVQTMVPLLGNICFRNRERFTVLSLISVSNVLLLPVFTVICLSNMLYRIFEQINVEV